MTVRKIFQYIVLAVGAFSVASCTGDLYSTTVTMDGKNIRFVVGDFPAFGESSTRSVGTPDEGKTEWADGDELLLEVNSKTLGAMYATFTYNGSEWKLTDGELSYKEDEVPSYSVYYAPDYKWISGKLELKDGKVAGTDEYIEGTAQPTSDGKAITVSFSNAKRNYSRLRIATIPDAGVNVAVEYFTPAGGSGRLDNVSYSVHSDANGNAYLYGKFVRNSTVSVKYGDVALTAYTFSGPTDMGKSYALDATVLLLEGMSLEEIDAAVEKMASEVNAGKTDFNVLLSPEPDREVFENIHTGLAEAGYCTINLTLMRCKKIPAGVFRGCNWLKSIALPAVTEIGESAFAGCSWLQKIVFDTPLTKVYGNPNSGGGIFEGCTTRGIDLVLSSEQKVMTSSQIDDKDVWTPSWENYNNSNYYKERKFLGYENFKSVNCGGVTL